MCTGQKSLAMDLEMVPPRWRTGVVVHFLVLSGEVYSVLSFLLFLLCALNILLFGAMLSY